MSKRNSTAAPRFTSGISLRSQHACDSSHKLNMARSAPTGGWPGANSCQLNPRLCRRWPPATAAPPLPSCWSGNEARPLELYGATKGACCCRWYRSRRWPPDHRIRARDDPQACWASVTRALSVGSHRAGGIAPAGRNRAWSTRHSGLRTPSPENERAHARSFQTQRGVGARSSPPPDAPSGMVCRACLPKHAPRY